MVYIAIFQRCKGQYPALSFYSLRYLDCLPNSYVHKINPFTTKRDCRRFNPLPDKLSNLNFHPLEVVSRWRDPQLQMFGLKIKKYE